MNFDRSILIGFIFSAGILQSQLAAAMDCTRASTRVEKLICKDPDLRAADTRLSEAYFRLLKSTIDKDFHASLIASQRRWLIAREAQYPSNSADDLRPLVLSEIDARLHDLGDNSKLGKANLIETMTRQREYARKYMGGSYAGYDFQCHFEANSLGDTGIYICNGSAIFRNNDRLCRNIQDASVLHSNDYRTVATLTGTRVKLIATCTDGYATSNEACPYPHDRDESGIGWNLNPKISDEVPDFKMLPNSPLTKYDPDADLRGEDWVEKCLTDPNYPSSKDDER